MKIADSCLLAFLLTVGLINSTPAEAQRHDRDYNNRRYSYPVRAQRVVYDYHPRYVTPYSPYRQYPYYYDNYYYRPYGSSIQVVVPPLGIHVSVLPRGYRPVYIGSHVYFYSNGIFYRRGEYDRDYEVVHAPIGADLPEIPDGARVIVVDDQKYYEYRGTYYKERIRQNGEIWYEVVGKNGKLQTDAAVSDDVRLGSMVNTLPSGCKVVIINNEKYYVSPDDVYYQEVIENNQLYYKVTGVPSTPYR